MLLCGAALLLTHLPSARTPSVFRESQFQTTFWREMGISKFPIPIFLPLLLLLLHFHEMHCSVMYDRKAMIINGERRILISGEIHYARSTPDAKDGGLDVIQTYVFWNGHEPSLGNYNFEGRYDLDQFVKTVQKAGMYVHLCIRPYACAEWNFGGFSVWLKYVPGISFRTDNEPFKIENEYGSISKILGPPGYAYMTWASKMVVGMDTGVPWVLANVDNS